MIFSVTQGNQRGVILMQIGPSKPFTGGRLLEWCKSYNVPLVPFSCFFLSFFSLFYFNQSKKITGKEKGVKSFLVQHRTFNSVYFTLGDTGRHVSKRKMKLRRIECGGYSAFLSQGNGKSTPSPLPQSRELIK